MKAKVTIITLMLLMTIGSKAQSLAGRVYSNPNIMAGVIEEQMKDLDIEKQMNEAIAKAEKEKGRKLTDKEMAEAKKKMDEAMKMAEAVRKGMSVAVSIEFINETDAVYKMKTRVDEELLKLAGVGWLKRKAFKAALALAPESEKGTYIVQGDLVIFDPESDADTLRLSADRRQLFGRDKDRKEPMDFTLTLEQK